MRFIRSTLPSVVMTRTPTTPVASPCMESPSSTEPRSYRSSSLDTWVADTGQIVPDQDTERWVSYSISDLYPSWQSRAHCSGVGVAYYFGDDQDRPTMSINAVRRASKLCDVCPVFYECLHHALTTREEYGVWAGTSGRVRRRIFKMVDNGETTVAEVIEVFRDGQGDRYRLPSGQVQLQDVGAFDQGQGEHREGGGGLRAPVGREVAL